MLNPCVRESKVQTGRFLREKLISDHGLFSFQEGQQGAANFFFRDTQGFGRLDAGLACRLHQLEASTTMGIGNSVFLISIRCVALRNSGLLIKPDWSVIRPICC